MTDQPDSIIKLDAERQLSTNTKWLTEVQGQIFDLQTTIRDTLTTEQIKGHFGSVLMAIDEIIAWGGTAKSVGTPPAAVTTVATTAPPVPAPVINEAPAPAQPTATSIDSAPATPTAPAQSGAPLTFPTASLIVTISNGKKLFKVTGGQFSKFGVTVWPEVLGKVANCEQMEGKTYEFVGYIATYTLNDQGKPHKITHLEKVS